MDISVRLSGGGLMKGVISSPGENVKALIFLVHGLGEHTGRYDHWIKAFSSRGIGMAALDLPGHGKSDGRRGHIRNYKVINELIEMMLIQYRKTFPGIPLFLYGHSLGGGMVLQYILKKKPAIRGAVISSPWLKLSFEPEKSKLLLASVMQHILPSLTQPSGLKVDHLSHDPEIVRKYVDDPLVHDRISVSLFHSAVSAGSYCLANSALLSVPALIIHGADDKITSPEASRQFASSAEKAELKIWESGFHELHNETFKDEVLSYIADWIGKKI
jgi:alpha-beta hydrolase superfamily lysophospholipase